MSDVNRYFHLIEHNVKLLDLLTGECPQHLENEDFSGWQVTVIFYISCIYIKAACCLFGINIQDHYALRKIINTEKDFLSISKFYRHIEEASRDARYEGRKFSKDFIINTILPKFNTIRDCIINIIKRKGINTVICVDIEPFLARLA